jgi:hypothetical protein
MTVQIKRVNEYPDEAVVFEVRRMNHAIPKKGTHVELVEMCARAEYDDGGGCFKCKDPLSDGFYYGAAWYYNIEDLRPLTSASREAIAIARAAR